MLCYCFFIKYHFLKFPFNILSVHVIAEKQLIIIVHDCDWVACGDYSKNQTISKYHFKTVLTVIVFNHRLGAGTCSSNTRRQKLGERSLLSGHLHMFTRKWPAISQTNAGFAPERCVINAIYKPHAEPDHKESRGFSTGCFGVMHVLSIPTLKHL